MSHILSETCYWGFDPATFNGIFQAPGNPEPSSPAFNLVPIDNKLFTFGKEAGDLNQVYSQGSWKTAGELLSAVDMASDGTAIGRSDKDLTAPIFINGKHTPAAKVLPQVPALWKDGSVRLIDTTPGGWILAERGDTIAPDYAALLPLRVEGNLERNGVIYREAVGVDAFSIGSTEPGDSVKDRIWIMAPAGNGETRVRLKTPIHGTTPLEIRGAGLRFDGASDFKTITGPETEFTIQATEGTPSGTEIPLTLKLGTGQAQSVSFPIAAKVMKRRVVRVRVWRVKSDDYPGKPSALPKFNPSNQEIETYLNELFGPQINAVFTCNDETVGPLGFDIADGGDFGGTEGALAPGNAMLDINAEIGGEEISTIRAGNYVSTYNINLYLVGGATSIQPVSWDAAGQKFNAVKAADRRYPTTERLDRGGATAAGRGRLGHHRA